MILGDLGFARPEKARQHHLAGSRMAYIAAIVGGIYRLIDMGSTTINVMGDMVGTAIISRSEESHVASTAA